MELDAAIHDLISVFFTLLLLWTSVHKFSDRSQFVGILASYQLLPRSLLALFAPAIPLLELGLGLAWITGLQSEIVALTTATLLALYSSAIGINIVRGNTEIDCGCGLSSSKHKAAGYQKLSAGLLVRNGILILLSLCALLPGNNRILGLVDYASLAFACAVMFLIYAAFNQLLANKQLIESWRKPLLQQGDNNG